MAGSLKGLDSIERLATAPTSPEAWVRAVRRRLLGRSIGFAWVALLFLSSVALLLWLVVGAGSGSALHVVRLGISIGAVGALIITVYAIGAHFSRRSGSALGRLRENHPTLGDDLEGALGLCPGQGCGSALAESFARCHRARVIGRLLEVPPSAVVAMPGLGRLIAASALLCGLVAVGLTLVPGARSALSVELGLEGVPDRLPWVLSEPAARPLRVEVQPPRYTRLPARIHEKGLESVEVPEGSRVTALFEAPHQVGLVRALLPGEELARGESLGDQMLRVRFTMRQEGPLVLALGEPSGALRVGLGGPFFRLVPDRPPGISVRPSGAVIRLERAEPMDLKWESDDDYGITAVRLSYQVDDAESRSVELFRGPRFGQGKRGRQSGTHRWDLAELRLAPGSMVRFHLEAEDNRSLQGGQGGPGRTTSPTQEIRIEGSKDARQDVLESLRPLLADNLTALADRYERFLAEAGPSGCPLVNQELERQRDQELALSESFSAYVERVCAMGETLMPLLLEVFDGPLRKLARRLSDVTRADRARGLPGAGSDCLSVARATSGPVVEVLEELALQLDALSGRATLEEMKDIVRRAEQLRREIRRLTERLRQTPDAAASRELGRATAELRRSLVRLSRLASSLGDEVMEEHVNRYAMRESERDRIMDGLARPEKGSDPLGALDRMVSQLDEAVGQGIDRFRQVMPIPGDAQRDRRSSALRDLAERQLKLQGELAGTGDPRSLSGAQRELASDARRMAGSAPFSGGDAAKLQGKAGADQSPGGKGRADGSPEEGARSGPSLGEAARRMEEAAAALGRGDRKAARRLGEETLGMLGELQAEAERAGRLTRPPGADGPPPPGAVEVPPAGGDLPRELRDSIQEAGRAGWPEPFREALRRYYERLLR